MTVAELPEDKSLPKRSKLQDWMDLLEAKEHKSLGSNLMATWVDYMSEEAYKKMLNRFKRMPNKLFYEGTLDSMIKKQKYQLNSEEAISYPFSSLWPLPLWTSNMKRLNN